MSWCLHFLSYKVHTLWAGRDADFWVHFDAFHSFCHWDICWQPKRVEAPLQFSLGAFKVYFVFVLYSRLAAVIFLLSFWYYYWPWVHFLTQTGWGLFVAIPFPCHISCLKRDPTASVSVPPEWKRGNAHTAAPLSPCHRQAPSLAPAGLCSPGAMEMGTRVITVCPRGRQDHHQLSQGDLVQSLVVDQAAHVSHRPDVGNMARCWWRGAGALCPSPSCRSSSAESGKPARSPWTFTCKGSSKGLCIPSLSPQPFPNLTFSKPQGLTQGPSTPHVHQGQCKEEPGLAEFGSSQGHSWSNHTLACIQLAWSCSPSVHKHRC